MNQYNFNYSEELPIVEDQFLAAIDAFQGADPITQIIILSLVTLLTVGAFTFAFYMIKLVFVFIYKTLKGIISIIAAKPKTVNVNTTQYRVRPVEQRLKVQPIVAAKPEEPKYFCSNCGATFTSQMLSVIRTQHKAYCEGCGQGFMVADE